MRRRIFWVVIGVPLALIIIGAGAALSLPTGRHIISGLWNTPDRLPALSTNIQVHFQPGAEDYARDVAALLPDDETAPRFSVALMELGATVCTARTPRCGLCPLDACAWRHAGYPPAIAQLKAEGAP